MSSGTAVAVSLTVVAGLAGAVQAAVMGELGERVGIAPALAFAVLVSLVCAIALLVAWERSFGGLADAARQPAWLWLGGVMSVFIVLAITVAAPRIGVAATIGIVIAGNLVMGALIDQYGLLGQEQASLTWPRLLGLL
ncbi:MAG TPA: DMT family transporter, partial [Gaiellaceae bacterium]|nr:DMT family transporter [Gaiellaceae bacterium]